MGLQPHSGVTSLFSMRTESLASSQRGGVVTVLILTLSANGPW